MSNEKINWHTFNYCNSNIQGEFENLCRLLFQQLFAREGTILSSSSNNPGIECEPVPEKATNKLIGFQAKYFSSRIDYKKIENSAAKIIKHYSGRIDKVFLFSNKDFTLQGIQYKRIEKMLAEANIELVAITNNAILDEVRKRRELQDQFFNLSIVLQQADCQSRSQIDLPPNNSDNNKRNIINKTSDAFKAVSEKRTLPPNIVNSMRQLLQLSPDLSADEVISQFLHYTNSVLENDIRHNVPEYIYDIPRAVYPAKLYVDDNEEPVFYGNVEHYFCNDKDRFVFMSDHFSLSVEYVSQKTNSFFIYYNAQLNSAVDRLSILKAVQSVLLSNIVIFQIDNWGRKTLSIKRNKRKYAFSYDDEKKLLNYWIEEMEKILKIEQSYNISINLQQSIPEKVEEFYRMVDVVYNGLVGLPNNVIYMPSSLFSGKTITISQPELLNEFDETDKTLPPVNLYGHIFHAKKSTLIPTKIQRKHQNKNIMELPVCIEFQLSESEENS